MVLSNLPFATTVAATTTNNNNYYHFTLLRIFHTSVSRWFPTGVWETESLLKSPGLFSVFWPISIMLSFRNTHTFLFNNVTASAYFHRCILCRESLIDGLVKGQYEAKGKLQVPGNFTSIQNQTNRTEKERNTPEENFSKSN